MPKRKTLSIQRSPSHESIPLNLPVEEEKIQSPSLSPTGSLAKRRKKSADVSRVASPIISEDVEPNVSREFDVVDEDKNLDGSDPNTTHIDSIPVNEESASRHEQADDTTSQPLKNADEISNVEDTNHAITDLEETDQHSQMNVDLDNENEESGMTVSQEGSKENEPEQVPNADQLVSDRLKNSKAIQDEKAGSVDFRVVENDGKDESMILLTGLKNIFQKQLPNMPKEYIARLVYDKTHRSMAVVRHPLIVVGGITYRPFPRKDFAEIVFCAIASTEQVQGYGSRLMSHVKDYVRATYNIRHFLTYADNYAIGYFKKQGFTTDITMDRSLWMGYIKDYEGGTLMQCKMVDKVKYLDVVNLISSHRWIVFKKIKEATVLSQKVYPGLKFPEGGQGIDPSDIPGLREAGWNPQLSNEPTKPTPGQRGPLYILMKRLVTEMTENQNAWPFAAPVSGVADYYDVIKNPMDLRTLGENVEADKYSTLDAFVNDTQLIFDNCRTYNQEGSPYYKCANRLEKYFKERLKLLKIEKRVP